MPALEAIFGSSLRNGPVHTNDHARDCYYPYFDWLRFVLAVVVMMAHDGVIGSPSGNLAVHVFFVLSGWLIGGILLNTTPRGLPRFFYNRALRIWIPYYIAAALIVGLSLVRDDTGLVWRQLVTFKLTMVYNLFSGIEVLAGFPNAPLKGTGHHLWSVNAEEQFYLGAPLLLVVLVRWGRSPGTWAAIALGFLALGTDYPGLSLGVLAAILLKDTDLHLRPWGVTTLVALGVITVPLLLNPNTYMRAAPFFGLAVVLLLARSGTGSASGAVFGGLSYPLYLNHWIGIYVSNAAVRWIQIDASLTKHAITFVTSVGFAWLHYLAVDRVIRRQRASWYTERTGRAVMALAYAIFGSGFVYGFMTVGRIV
jgi:peptidoglycan/LPS O-acetylase OafA/YrhL